MTVPSASLPVYTCWKNRRIPMALRRCAESLAKLSPGHPCELWNDADCLRLVGRLLPALPPELRRGVYLADIWRCAMLLESPGIYADLDIEWIQSVDSLINAACAAGILRSDTEVLLTTDHPFHSRRASEKGGAVYMNDFMIALQPGSELFRRYLEKVGSLSREDVCGPDRDPVFLTGPAVLTKVIESAGGPESLRVGVLPWQWIHPLPDMTLDFPGWDIIDKCIRSGRWRAMCEEEPFVVHHWWHSYLDRSMLGMYGDALYQGDGEIVERRLNSMLGELGNRAESTGTALAEFAQDGGGDVIDLSPRASASGSPDETAPPFSSVLARALDGLRVSYHAVDIRTACNNACSGMEAGTEDGWQCHAKTPSEFLRTWSGSAGLIRMGAYETDRTSVVDAARTILARGLVRPRGLVLVSNDAQNHQGNGHGVVNAVNVFEHAQYRVLGVADDGGEVLLEAPPAPPIHGPIPKIIHQTWKNLDVVEPFRREWADSWMEVNADAGWQYRFWTDEDIDEFVASEFPEFYETYSEYDVHIKRVDAVRYLILKRIGGVYADMDSMCLRPLDDLLEGRSLVFAFERPLRPRPGPKPPSVGNAIMAGSPNHPFWNGLEAHLHEARSGFVINSTGPAFLTARVKGAQRYLSRESMPTLLQCEAFYPYPWNSPLRWKTNGLSRIELAARFPGSHCMNFWTGTWSGPKLVTAMQKHPQRFSRNNREYRDRPKQMILPAVDCTNPVDLLAEMIEHLVPTDLTRYGPDSDGGYHVPARTNYDKIITIGVGSDIAFEVSYAAAHPGARFELFDHTIADLPSELPNSRFHQAGVGFGECLVPLPILLEEYGNGGETILLKMDCEGAEWRCGMAEADFRAIHTLVLEIHDVLALENQPGAAAVMNAIASQFVLVHANPNNYSASGLVQGHTLTNCVELTLVNRSRVDSLPPRRQPVPQGVRNSLKRPPVRLEIIKRGSRIPTVISAFFSAQASHPGDPDELDHALGIFSRIENPLVFFADDTAIAERVQRFRADNIHVTRVVAMNQAGLRSFDRRESLDVSIVHDAGARLGPEPLQICVQHAKYDLVSQAVEGGLIGTSHCCWIDSTDILESLGLVQGVAYQFHHRALLEHGVHYSRARTFPPKAPDAGLVCLDGACNSLSGGFFYGGVAYLSDWCATYVAQSLRYRKTNPMIGEESTLHALLSEGFGAGVTAHDFPNGLAGMCDFLLTAVAQPSEPGGITNQRTR